MIRRILMLAGATLTIAAAQPAAKPAQAPPAKPTPPATTINCLLASNAFAEHETNPQQKALAQELLFFYLGRLDPHATEPQLKAAVKQTGDALKGVNVGSLLNECLVDLRGKATMIQTVGQQLQQGK